MDEKKIDQIIDEMQIIEEFICNRCQKNCTTENSIDCILAFATIAKNIATCRDASQKNNVM